MITSALVGLFGGLLAGRRFKAFALVPVLFAALVAAVILAVAGVLSAGAAGLAFLGFAVGLQVGYAITIALGAGARKPLPARPLTT